MASSSQATIALAFLHPLLDELKILGFSESEMAGIVGVTQDVLRDPSQLLPANQLYNALAKATEVVGNDHLCFQLGCKMANGGWSPVRPYFQRNNTVIDFFSEFSAMAETQGRAARYRLEVEGKVAVLILRRPASASTKSRYADAIAAGFFLTILRNALSNHWDAAMVTLVLPDRNLVPEDELPRSSVLLGTSGMSIRFPSKYLGVELPKPEAFVSGPTLAEAPSFKVDLVERVRQIIELQLEKPKLGPIQIAEALGIEKWRLQELLSKTGRSITQIRDEVKRAEAINRLENSEDSVGKIAAELGYTDSANFARAFKRWTGFSPTEVRNGQMKQPISSAALK